MKVIKKILPVLFVLFLIALAYGFYAKQFMENDILGDRIIGICVFAGVFILMPLFLYLRFKGKKLKDYTLTNENIKKMRDKLQE